MSNFAKATTDSNFIIMIGGYCNCQHSSSRFDYFDNGYSLDNLSYGGDCYSGNAFRTSSS